MVQGSIPTSNNDLIGRSNLFRKIFQWRKMWSFAAVCGVGRLKSCLGNRSNQVWTKNGLIHLVCLDHPQFEKTTTVSFNGDQLSFEPPDAKKAGTDSRRIHHFERFVKKKIQSVLSLLALKTVFFTFSTSFPHSSFIYATATDSAARIYSYHTMPRRDHRERERWHDLNPCQ